MNPEDLIKTVGSYQDIFKGSSLYGSYGENLTNEDFQELMNNFMKEERLKKSSDESKKKSETIPEKKTMNESGKEKAISVSTKQEHTWKLRERRYRAWVTQNGAGKMIESNQFHFLSEFFQHLEEEYDLYDLMDGVCVNQEKDSWLYEGDVVSVTGGEFHQGYNEYNVTGVFDCRGGSYCVVDFNNVIYPIEHLFHVDDCSVEVVCHAYDNHFQEVQEAHSKKGNKDSYDFNLSKYFD